MPSSDVIVVVLMLLPGFVTAAVFNAISIRRKRSQFETISEVILFELLVVTSHALIARSWTLVRLTPATSSSAAGLEHNAIALVAIAVIAVAWGLLLGTVHNHDWAFSALRRCRVTRQSSHVSVWSGAFYNLDSWVVIHLASGTRIFGWPAHFADAPEEGSAFLTHAAYLGDDGNVIEIPGPGILVTKEAGIRMVEFLRDEASTEIMHARIDRRSAGRP